jgi:hypothetical protein
VTVAGPERSLLFIATLDGDPVIGVLQVKRGEDLRSAQPIERLRDERKGRTVLNSKVVQSAVINAETHAAILLLGEEDRRTRLGYAAADPSILLGCEKVLSQSF